jgi:hypothetical protein
MLIRKSDRSWPKSDGEKATTFAEHLEQVFTPNSKISKVPMMSLDFFN